MFRAAWRGIPLNKCSHCHLKSWVSLFPTSCICQISTGSSGRVPTDTPTRPDLTQRAAQFEGELHPVMLPEVPGLSSTTACSQQGQHKACRNTVPIQSSHATGPKRTSGMFSAFVLSCHEASPVPSLSSRRRRCFSHIDDVEHLPHQQSPTFDDAIKEEINAFHSVLGSRHVHNQGHYWKNPVLPGDQL